VIRSMTGYGRAESTDDQVRIAVEVRSVNNRFLKVSQRLPEGLTSLEVPIENLVRKHLSRGTVNLNLVVEPRGAAVRAPINAAVLSAYWKDLAALARETGGAARPPALEALLGLPGVVGTEEALLTGIVGLEERVTKVVAETLERLDRMRAAEGASTAGDLAAILDAIEERLAAIQARAPQVMGEVRQRLAARVESLLADIQLAPDDPSLMREVAFLAERSDINEELARLASHTDQFRGLLSSPDPAGRRCEFLAQEMYREINTIGSKANDAEIARQAVEVKVGVDRLREQSQNVE